MTHPNLVTKTSFENLVPMDPAAGRGLLLPIEALLATASDGRTTLTRRLRLLAAIARRVDTLFQLRANALRGASAGALGVARRRQLRGLLGQAQALWTQVLLPALREREVAIAEWTDLGAEDQRELTRIFTADVSPLLTPLTVDAAHPFPAVASLALNVAVLARDRRSGTERFIGIEIPPTVPRFLGADSGSSLVPLESVLHAHLPALFPDLEVLQQHTFRVTRDGRPRRARGANESLGIRTRAAVRLEVDAAMSASQRRRLVEGLGLEADDVDSSIAPLDLGALDSAPLTRRLSGACPGSDSRLSRGGARDVGKA